MGVIVIEGLVVTLLVLVGLREAIMHAVPLALKRSIGVGIGLFILFIGFANGGLIAGQEASYGSIPAVTLRPITETAQFVFLFGLFLTIILWALKVKAALIISILTTTIVVDHRRRVEGRHPHVDAELLDARPRPPGSVPGVRDPGRAVGDPHDLLDHADRLLRHDGHRHRRRGRGRSRRGGRSRAGRRSRPARGLRGGLRRWGGRDVVQHDLHRERRRRRRGRTDRASRRS